MATWKAKCWLGSSAGYQELEVQASTLNGAKQQFERIYGAEQIINLRQVDSSSGSSGGSEIDGAGVIGLIGLAAAAWAFVSFTPIILMLVGGAAATWVGQLITGQTVEEYVEREDDSGHGKAAIVLALALIAGGFGFIQGDQIKKGFDSPSTPAQVQSK